MQQDLKTRYTTIVTGENELQVTIDKCEYCEFFTPVNSPLNRERILITSEPQQ